MEKVGNEIDEAGNFNREIRSSQSLTTIYKFFVLDWYKYNN